jgi:hypothetical protein
MSATTRCRSWDTLVALRIPIEAAGADSFIAQVRAMDTEQLGATARLPMAGPKRINFTAPLPKSPPQTQAGQQRSVLADFIQLSTRQKT